MTRPVTKIATGTAADVGRYRVAVCGTTSRTPTAPSATNQALADRAEDHPGDGGEGDLGPGREARHEFPDHEDPGREGQHAAGIAERLGRQRRAPFGV